jgi:hypothetical protein
MARAALAGLLVCLLALTGCSALADLGQLREDLDSAGYDAAGIDHDTTNGYSVLTIEATTAGEPTDSDAEEIGRVAWTTFPGEIDRMEIILNGWSGFSEDYDDLLVRYGERPEDLPGDDGDDSNSLTVILIAVGVAVVFTGLMVLLWRRGRRSVH